VRLDARTEFEILAPSPKGGIEAGHAPSYTALGMTSFTSPLWRALQDFKFATNI